MAAGTILWKLNFQLNSGEWGSHFSCQIADVAEDVVRARTLLIGNYIRNLLPSTAELFFARYSRDDTKKNGRSVRGCRGAGLFLQGVVGPVATPPDNSRSALNIRFESIDGEVVSRKFAPLPDSAVTDDFLTSAVAEIVYPVVGAIDAPSNTATYTAGMLAFLQYLTMNTHHVVSGHAPGAAFTYFNWYTVGVEKLTTKKGARIFR